MTTNQTETLHIDFPDISNGIKLTYTTISSDINKTAIFKIIEQGTNTDVSNAVIKWIGDQIIDIKINFISGTSTVFTKAIRNTILNICDEL